MFEKINNNIKMVNDLKTSSSRLSDEIINLLIQVESKPDSPDNYADQIQELKNIINDFQTQSEEVKSKVLLNDIKINTFFQKSIVKKYLSNYNIEVNVDNQTVQTHTVSDKETPDTPNFENEEENHTLLVSEKMKKVFLPYSKQEVLLYLEQYPDEYKSFEDVVNKEFIFPLDYYIKHPVLTRFREAYSLIRDRESKSVIDAFKFAIDLMFNYDLNPAIIAACKTQDQLENYLSCLERNRLDEFTDFEIKFEINPL